MHPINKLHQYKLIKTGCKLINIVMANLENLKKDLILVESLSDQNKMIELNKKLHSVVRRVVGLNSLRGKEVETLKNCVPAINSVKTKAKGLLRFKNYVNLAIERDERHKKEAIKRRERDYTKAFKHEILREFAGFFNVFNHVSKSLKADKVHGKKAKETFTRKFEPSAIYAMFNFDELLTVIRTNGNFAQKSNFNLLVDKMIAFSNLETEVQGSLIHKGKDVNSVIKQALEVATVEQIKKLHELSTYKKPTKSNAKFMYDLGSPLFKMLNLVEVYNREEEEAKREKARKVVELGKIALEKLRAESANDTVKAFAG